MTSLTCFKEKTIVVTGASGFIASALINKLSQVKCRLILVSRNKEYKADKSNLAKITIVHEKTNNPKLWKKLTNKTDIIFHLAAQTNAKLSSRHLVRDINDNLLSAAYMVDACLSRHKPPDIIFSGSVTETGFTDYYPVNESRNDLPITVYDIHKLTAEKYFQYYSNQLGNRAVTLRLANVYGPGNPINNSGRNLVNIMIRRALNNKDLTIYDQGQFIRDYVYIDDVVDAFLIAAKKIRQLSGHYYIIGSNAGYMIRELAQKIAVIVEKKTNYKTRIKSAPMPPDIMQIDKRNFVADSGMFKTQTGWFPKYSLNQGLEKTIDYHLLSQKIHK